MEFFTPYGLSPLFHSNYNPTGLLEFPDPGQAHARLNIKTQDLLFRLKYNLVQNKKPE